MWDAAFIGPIVTVLGVIAGGFFTYWYAEKTDKDNR